MRSRRLSNGSWVAAGKVLAALTTALVLGACSAAQTATSSPTPSPSPSLSPSIAPPPTPSGGETPVSSRILAPAPDLPVAALCSAPITATADGNATPLLCHNGAVNVLAWSFYAGVSASVMGLGLNPTAGQVQSAICDDFAHNHATRVEETSGYKLASTYYAWTFNIDPAKLTCQ